MRLYLILALVSLSTLSCALIGPCGSSKAEYIEAWEKLLKDAKEESNKDNPSWAKLDKRYEQLYEECRLKWEGELTIAESLKVGGIIAQYHGQKLLHTKLKDVF